MRLCVLAFTTCRGDVQVFFCVESREKRDCERDERSSMMERGDEKKKKGKAIRSKERNRLTEGKREREKERKREREIKYLSHDFSLSHSL